MAGKLSYTDIVQQKRDEDNFSAGAKNKLTVGGASVFSMLVVMCLAVFALITVVTANRELELSQKAAAATKEYYGAVTSANELYGDINGMYHGGSLSRVERWVDSNVTYTHKMELRRQDVTELIVIYNVPINSNSELVTEVSVSAKGVKKQRQYALVTGSWDTTPLPLWDEDEPGGFGEAGDTGFDPFAAD